MKKTKGSWRNDWQAFIESVTKELDRGLSDVEITNIYSGKQVTWVGKVSELQLDDNIPGVQMEMSAVVIKCSDGRHSTVDYLYLNLSQNDAMNWRNISSGEIVRFQTEISKETAPFPGIQWSSLDEKRGVLQIGTHNSKLVEIVETTA